MSTFKPFVVLAALSPILLAGCGAKHLGTVKSAKTQLVGQEATVLSRCIGEPLTVESSSDASSTSHLYSSAQMRGADGLLKSAPPPDAAASAKACVFDVTIEEGRIVSVESENRAGWGFGSITNCSAVVEQCVSN